MPAGLAGLPRCLKPAHVGGPRRQDSLRCFERCCVRFHHGSENSFSAVALSTCEQGRRRIDPRLSVFASSARMRSGFQGECATIRLRRCEGCTASRAYRRVCLRRAFVSRDISLALRSGAVG
jgi:hypothetical protein